MSWWHRKSKDLGTQMAEGSRAHNLLQDDLLTDVVQELRADCVEAWRVSDTVEDRELAHARLVAVDSFEARLRGLIQLGKRASDNLAAQNDDLRRRREEADRLGEQERQQREAAENLRRIQEQKAS